MLGTSMERDGKSVTILLIDDEEPVAKAVQATLRTLGYRVPEVVTSAGAFDAALDRVHPDLVLLDIDLGGEATGIELAGRVPLHVPFVFLSAHADDRTLGLAGERRPAGFVVKPFERAQLAAAVEMALAGRRSSPDGASALADVPELAPLSRREREVLEQLVAHKRAPAIAKALFISQHTVRNHLKKIFSKLEVRSQQELLDLVTNAATKRR